MVKTPDHSENLKSQSLSKISKSQNSSLLLCSPNLLTKSINRTDYHVLQPLDTNKENCSRTINFSKNSTQKCKKNWRKNLKELTSSISELIQENKEDALKLARIEFSKLGFHFQLQEGSDIMDSFPSTQRFLNENSQFLKTQTIQSEAKFTQTQELCTNSSPDNVYVD